MSLKAFRIGREAIAPGERRTVNLPVSVLTNHTPVTLPVHVLHGERPGPALFVSGAVHGDEIIGIEVVRRLVAHAALKDLAGTLLAVPIVNAFGFISQSRYMPDRRDLNRSFPGSDKGSLASVLADLFTREIMSRAQYGVDIHSAALHRTNLPQIRIAPGEPDLLKLARDFGPPVVLVSPLRDGSLRQSALERGVKVLLYEGGEALRFDETAIQTAVLGILRVMKSLGMTESREVQRAKVPAAVSQSSTWLRAPEGGILRSARNAGERVAAGETIGEISDPLGEKPAPVIAQDDGIVIGRTNLPVVHRGDALFHIARIAGAYPPAPLFDEDEII
jgi:uncharacterized protein